VEEAGDKFVLQFNISPSDRWKTEVVNKSLGNLLRSLVTTHQCQWDQILPQEEFCIQ
jgi:hypothetical protein